MKIQILKIGEKIVMFYPTNKESVSIPCTYVEKEWGGLTYNVYRSRVSFSRYHQKWELSNGWNLFQRLSKSKALQAAKISLQFLD